ncbi:MAG TPA: hypothetical protein VNC59_04300 [Thermoanaerobaculia bacterium]|nr:hypothetical protein [Thermoanaerobaculia bacterium]
MERRRAVTLLVALCALVGCSYSRITSLDRQRAAPGEEFTIHGKDLDNFGGPDPVAPVLHRCDKFTLEVVQWFDDDVRVRVPANVPAGVYEVYAFGRPSGAYQRNRTNSLPIWVTPASVPASVVDKYDVQIQAVRKRYGKTLEWENWMIANRDRYAPVFAAAHALPCPISIDVRYETPLAYNPPWTSEAEHMTALNRMGGVMFPGYRYDFRLGRDTPGAYAQVALGHVGNSYASGRTVYLHYEGIFGHEFGHVLNVLHHYDTDEATGRGQHFPPGERGCTMDRNENQYCSACRAALNVPLDVDNWAEINSAIDVIQDRYPPGW